VIAVPRAFDLAVLYAAGTEGLPLPDWVTAQGLDPLTGALTLMLAAPKKAVRRVVGGYPLAAPGFQARVDVDTLGRPLLLVIQPT
jgi:hypothetical protein